MVPSAGFEPAILPLGGVCIIRYATKAMILRTNRRAKLNAYNTCHEGILQAYFLSLRF